MYLVLKIVLRLLSTSSSALRSSPVCPLTLYLCCKRFGDFFTPAYKALDYHRLSAYCTLCCNVCDFFNARLTAPEIITCWSVTLYLCCKRLATSSTALSLYTVGVHLLCSAFHPYSDSCLVRLHCTLRKRYGLLQPRLTALRSSSCLVRLHCTSELYLCCKTFCDFFNARLTALRSSPVWSAYIVPVLQTFCDFFNARLTALRSSPVWSAYIVSELRFAIDAEAECEVHKGLRQLPKYFYAGLIVKLKNIWNQCTNVNGCYFGK
ncbi:hypothetical protein AVEN_219918-1 [Araneus ventricosus]|uniref:Secreted protein n=1 Tax=Araneus ventricosus TaxID=182803 RepID=A0A4Y2HJP4_ARAVE|nr:hypothetical protein AVEN_219918-1 [Araneus ventricosus]